MNNNLLSRVAAFLKQRMRTKRWQRAMTCLAAVVVFGVTYALILPAITMTGQHPTLSAETLTAWTGDELAVKVSAQAKGDEIVVFSLEGEGADLSQKYAFNEEGVCVITDEEEKEIELHRVVREDAKNTVDYWFAMGAGTKTVFTLNLADEVDETRFSEIMAAVEGSGNDKEEEIATASDAGKSAAVKTDTTGSNATASNAEKASSSNADVAEANSIAEKEEEKIVTESDDNGFVEILDGAVVNDLMGEDEDEGQTETVAELKVTAGSGADYDNAVDDVKKNADKRGDAQLKFKWIDVAASAPELMADVNDATIAVFFDEAANIPAGAKLFAEEIPAGSGEYQNFLAQADPAVTGGTEKMVTAARFFNISILDADENEIQPEAPVKVVIAYKDGISITEAGDLTVVHFSEDGGAPEVFTSVKNENGQSAEGIAFTTDSFSVFGLVGAENLAAGEIAAEVENGTVKVSYDSGAKLLPSDTLVVSEIPDGSGRYQTYMGEAGDVLLGKGKAAEISYARFFDISILRDGVIVEPQTPVQISIDYTASQDLGAGTTVSALNFKGKSADVLDVDLKGSETQLNGVSFGTGALATFGVTGTRGGKTKSLTAEGSTFKMTVSYGTEAEIPEGAKLKAEEVAEGTEEAGEYKKLAADAAKSKEEELSYIKVLKAAIVDAEGKQIQPAAPVDVEFKLDGKKNEFETLAVFFGGEAAEVITPQAEDDKVSFEAAKISDCAVVETKAPKTTKITGKASDGATVEITGKLPEGAEAKIVPVTLTQEQLVEYYGADLVKAVDNLVVYDICIMVDGKEWEPDDSVSVVINNPQIETKTNSNEEIAVTHIDDEKKSAEKMDTVVTEDGGVSFDTKSFSLWGLYTYTVDYYLNDNEYHQPGNTSMLLSELFVPLLVDIPVSEVADVQFTDYTLLSIEPEGEDFRITSLKPFTSHEVMTVILKNEAEFTIVVEDLMYANYTYQASDLTPCPDSSGNGKFNYVGHYNIFGGGNGIPSVAIDEALPDNWWAGQYGGNSNWTSASHPSQGGVTVTLPSLKGKAIGNDQNGVPLEPVDNKFRSGSSAEITWTGTIERAYMSFSWLYYFASDASNPTHALFDIKLYAPDGAFTTITINTDHESNDGRVSDYGTDTTQAWRMLSFEATDFVRAHGQGTYSMIVTVEPTQGHTTIGSYLSDMGFTIYGVTKDSSRPISAVVGVVDEIMISQSSQSLPNRVAEVAFAEPVSPRGNGKAWFNCQGGEYITTDSVEHDRDYLEAKTDDNKYLKFGEGGDISIPGWNAEDIACPNHNQTPPSGLEGYSNRCSFGLASFSGMQNLNKKIVGLRKRMAQGNDCFGSMMLLIEVMPTEGTVEVKKKLEYNGNGVNTGLPAAAHERKLKFHVEPTNNAPVPFKVEGGVEVPNQDYEVTFDAGAVSGAEILMEMGIFRFRGQDIPGSDTTSGPWTFVYEVTEDRSGIEKPWIYDQRTLLLTFTVSVDEGSGEFKIDNYTWSVKGNPQDTENFFKNTYVLPTELSVEKVNTEGEHIPGAVFCLYKNSDCSQLATVFTDEAQTVALTSAGATVDAYGLAHFYGIEKGASPYYLKELSVPAPYIVDRNVVTITYVESSDSWVYQAEGDERPTPLEPSVSDTKDLGTVTITRENKRTFDINVLKVDGSTEPPVSLPNATFTLYQMGATQYELFTGDSQNGQYTSGEDGRFVMHLPLGKYKLAETSVPKGYIMPNIKEFEFEVVDQAGDKVIFDGTGYEGFVEFDKDTLTFTVTNTRGNALPHTGGPGTTIYTLSGMMILIASALLYGFRRRHEERRSM